MINIVLMHKSQKRKQRVKKIPKKRKYTRSEECHYQKDNPLTIYYAKYIEKQD